ncbi:MAG: N-acetylornithine carbamoyltransferase [Haliscomenobacter sp.]
MNQFLSVLDVPNLADLIQDALACKQNPQGFSSLGKHKTLVMLFFNPSLRTRLSTEKAALNLGMQVISMNADQGWNLEFEEGVTMNAGSAEHVKEAAAVISQYADIIGVRTFPGLKDREKDYADQVIRSFVRYARVPVISLESAIRHPLQSLTDVLTVEEYKKTARPKVVLTWAPHPRALPQAVPNSFVEWMQQADVELSVAHPKGYELAPEFIKDTPVYYDQNAALEGADFVYAKNWSSYADYGKILNQDPNWQVTIDKMNRTNDAWFMHCLPVRRNVVVSDAVLDSPKSLVIDQANNRTYAAMAVLKAMLLAR